jgi:RPA family protein
MSESEDDGAGEREVAYRLFAAEFEDADLSYSAGDDDRSPNYVITPTGARVNRLFAVGVLTEVEQVSDDVLRGRVVDPTGAFVTYAGQYQPDVQAFLERAETPMFVAMTGKARTFQPEDSDQVYSSVRPESINEVDAETRDRWTVQATEQTLDRIGTVGTALGRDQSGETLEAALRDRGVSEELSAGIALALDHYGTTPTYLARLRELVLDAARVVAGQKGEVAELDITPDKSGPISVGDVADAGIDTSTPETADAVTEGASDSSDETTPDSATVGDNVHEGDAEATTGKETTTDTTAEATTTTEPENEAVAMDESDRTEEAVTETEDATTAESASVEETATTPEATEKAGSADTLDGPGEFDPEEFELEEETRKQVEEEFGTEFQTGTEVDEPGEADIETPAVDDSQEDEPEVDTATGDDETATTQAESESGDDSETESADAPDDLQSAVVELMGELDEGDGARSVDIVEEMTERYGVPTEETESAIQDALMDGECYEPDEGTLKPI